MTFHVVSDSVQRELTGPACGLGSWAGYSDTLFLLYHTFHLLGTLKRLQETDNVTHTRAQGLQ